VDDSLCLPALSPATAANKWKINYLREFKKLSRAGHAARAPMLSNCNNSV
jgi:hypothetical protein